MAAGRYCGYCGAATDPRARYCGVCGARLGTPLPSTTGQPVPSTTGQPVSAGGAARAVVPAAPLVVPPHASAPPVTGAVPLVPAGVAPAGGLSSTVVGRGRYVIEHLLGRGGMSAVYMARDTHISGRLVAVKEMVDSFADAQERLEAERDFAREADMLSRLRHQAIPAIFDRFSENSRHLLVMEYIAGENLEQMLAVHGPFAEEQVRAWALELCSVLSYLHAQTPPVVFRDLKPGNIIVQPDGHVRLIDFGIARLFKPQQKADTTALGTSGYASPEHYTGQTDARSDIYSLGATMHHLLTGRDPSRFPPFQFPPVRELNASVSSDLAAIIERAVRTDRAKRFASVMEMRDALERKRRRSKSATPAPAQQAAPTAAPPLATPNGAAPAQAPPLRPAVSPLSAPVVTSPPVPSVLPSSAPVVPPASTPVVPAPRQVLVLEAFTSNKRIDYDAVATLVAALTAGDKARLQVTLQSGLPVTIRVAPRGQTAADLQALVQLGVKARIVTPGMVPVLLDPDLRRRLDTTHQLLVRDVTVGPARLCQCRRCNFQWKTTKAVGDAVPLRCPKCRSADWGRWRIFKCAWCGHEFQTGDVDTQRTEKLFPTCPCCGLANWDTGQPRRPTGWLDRILAALAGTALLR